MRGNILVLILLGIAYSCYIYGFIVDTFWYIVAGAACTAVVGVLAYRKLRKEIKSGNNHN